MYVHVWDENGMLVKTFILTRSHYYERAKINAIIRRSNHYITTNEGIKMLIDGLSEHHFKTACLVQFESAINYYSENFNIYIKSRVDYSDCYDRPWTEEDGT